MRYTAFLRGINLGKRRLSMSKLKALFEELGFAQVETFIASGNVMFSTGKAADGARLEDRIAKHLESALGYPVDTFVRTAEEVERIVKSSDSERPGVTVHVAFMKEKLSAGAARKLAAINTGYDQFEVQGREFYWLTKGGISKSKVWTLPEVKAIGVPNCTMRNMTTVRKLAAKMRD